MNTEQFFQKIGTYTDLSTEAEEAWFALLKEKTYRRGENFCLYGRITITLTGLTPAMNA